MVHSKDAGSIMIIPREDGLCRFYIQLKAPEDGGASHIGTFAPATSLPVLTLRVLQNDQRRPSTTATRLRKRSSSLSPSSSQVRFPFFSLHTTFADAFYEPPETPAWYSVYTIGEHH